VKIGIAYAADTGAAVAAGGGAQAVANGGRDTNQLTPAALEAQFRAGLAYLNKHGGWAGCTVAPVFFQFKLLGNNYDEESQEECTTFAIDNHVFIAYDPGFNDTQVYVQCMADHHVPMVLASSMVRLDDALFKRYRGYLYQPWDISYDRMGAFIDALDSAKYFDPGSKVGIIIASNGTRAEEHLANHIWLPRLKAKHIPVTTFTYSNLRGFQDLSNASTQMSAAVLKFRQAGVDHVMFTPSSGISDLEFGNQAQSQQYYPRYGLASYDAAFFLSQKQQETAVKIAWEPDTDNPSGAPSVVASNPPNPAYKLCYSIYQQAGSNLRDYRYCDALFMVQQALALSPAMTPAGLLRGVEALGTSFRTAASYGPTYLGPGRYDGDHLIRPMKYDKQQKLFVYSGPLRTIP